MHWNWNSQSRRAAGVDLLEQLRRSLQSAAYGNLIAVNASLNFKGISYLLRRRIFADPLVVSKIESPHLPTTTSREYYVSHQPACGHWKGRFRAQFRNDILMSLLKSHIHCLKQAQGVISLAFKNIANLVISILWHERNLRLAFRLQGCKSKYRIQIEIS